MTRQLSTFALSLAIAGMASQVLAQQASMTLPFEGDVLRLSVDHPQELRAGRSYDYEIKIDNVSDNIAIHDLKLAQRTRASFEVESATIDGQKQSNTDATERSNKSDSKESTNDDGHRSHEWTIAKLEPGQSKTIRVSAVSDEEGPANLCFAITSYTPTLCISPKFVRPEVELVKRAPERVSLCQVINFEYEVTNTGSGDPGSFEIIDDLGELQTESGKQKLRFTVDGLPAGETRKFVADIIATKAGEYSSRAEAVLRGEERVKSKASTTQVISPQLAVAIDGPEMVYAEEPVQYTVRVTNDGNADADQAMLRIHFPTRMEMTSSGRVAASNEAVERPDGPEGEPTPAKKSSEQDQQNNDSSNDENQLAMETRDVKLGSLRAGETKQMSFTLRGTIDEMLPVRAEAKFTCQPGDSDETYEVTSVASTTTEVVSLPALLVAVVDERDPVKVQDEVVYEIIVRNQGTAPDENIQIEAELPEQLEFVSAKGETSNEEPDGKRVAFKKIDRMAPGEQAVWHVRAKATGEGDLRFKVHLTSDSLAEPATSEEPTRLFGGSTN